jgi:hypothetical protein
MAETNPIELQQALKGAQYPAKREQLADVAKKNGAGEQLVEKISGLDEKEFDGPDKVEHAVFRGR